jgi:hypothetical protein
MAEHLDVVGVTGGLAGIDVNEPQSSQALPLSYARIGATTRAGQEGRKKT